MIAEAATIADDPMIAPQTLSDALDCVRFDAARRLHGLGERPVYEFIREILAGAAPVDRLEAFGRIDPAIVKYLGADRMPPSMHTIPGDGRISVGGDEDAA